MPFNKIDLLEDVERQADLSLKYPKALFVSVHTGKNIPRLLELIEATVENNFTQLQLLIPHERYDLVARLHREGAVYNEEVMDQGTYIAGSAPDRLLKILEPYYFKGSKNKISA